jgi:CHAD domain-containing protein
MRSWHEIRINVKKFRYLNEALIALDDNAAALPAAELHSAQSALGKLRDFDLLRERLDRFAGRHPPSAAWHHRHRAALQRRRRQLLRASVLAVRRIARLLEQGGTSAGKDSR